MTPISLCRRIAVGYTGFCAAQVVEGANAVLKKGSTHHAYACDPAQHCRPRRILLAAHSLAIYALPFFIGLSIAFYAYDSGAGGPGATMLGVFTGGIVLALAQMAMALAASSWLRILLGLAFAIPAAIAGYYATFALAGLTFPTDAWRQAFAFVGAAAIGVTAWQRLAPMPASRDSHRMPAAS